MSAWAKRGDVVLWGQRGRCVVVALHLSDEVGLQYEITGLDKEGNDVVRELVRVSECRTLPRHDVSSELVEYALGTSGGEVESRTADELLGIDEGIDEEDTGANELLDPAGDFTAPEHLGHIGRLFNVAAPPQELCDMCGHPARDHVIEHTDPHRPRPCHLCGCYDLTGSAR